MSRTPVHRDSTAFSLRIPTAIIEWLREAAVDGAVTTLINKYLEGVRTYFQSAPDDLQLLEADAKRLSLARLDHFKHIIARYRNESLVAKGPQASASPPPATEAKPVTGWTAYSFRAPDSLLAWVAGEADKAGSISNSQVVNAVLASFRTYFGSTPNEQRLLQEDAKARGLDLYDHVHHILGEYRTDLFFAHRTGQPAGQAPAPQKPSTTASAPVAPTTKPTAARPKKK